MPLTGLVACLCIMSSILLLMSLTLKTLSQGASSLTTAKKRLEPHSRRGPDPAQRAGDKATSRWQEQPGTRRYSSAPRGSRQRAARWGTRPTLKRTRHPKATTSADRIPRKSLPFRPQSGQVHRTPASVSLLPAGPLDPMPLSILRRAGKGFAGRWDRPGQNNQE